LVSIGKASEIAEMPIQEFLVELRKRGIAAYPYSDEDALKELNL
jgi:predicted HTH domain antitoxin